MAKSQSASSETHLTPVRDAARRDAIIGAIAEYDLSESDSWSDLDSLSSHTNVEAIEANTQGIFDAGSDRFEATATVYVVLNYGDRKDHFSTTESFPAHVVGQVSSTNDIKIEQFTVDTSSFYDSGSEPRCS